MVLLACGLEVACDPCPWKSLPSSRLNGGPAWGQEMDIWLISRVWRCTCEARSSSLQSSWTRTGSGHWVPDWSPAPPIPGVRRGVDMALTRGPGQESRLLCRPGLGDTGGRALGRSVTPGLQRDCSLAPWQLSQDEAGVAGQPASCGRQQQRPDPPPSRAGRTDEGSPTCTLRPNSLHCLRGLSPPPRL